MRSEIAGGPALLGGRETGSGGKGFLVTVGLPQFNAFVSRDPGFMQQPIAISLMMTGDCYSGGYSRFLRDGSAKVRSHDITQSCCITFNPPRNTQGSLVFLYQRRPKLVFPFEIDASSI